MIETSSSDPAERRLSQIHDSLYDLMRWHQPSAVALEDLELCRHLNDDIAHLVKRLPLGTPVTVYA